MEGLHLPDPGSAPGIVRVRWSWSSAVHEAAAAHAAPPCAGWQCRRRDEGEEGSFSKGIGKAPTSALPHWLKLGFVPPSRAGGRILNFRAG